MKPVVLCILDGWGHRESQEDNSIALASIPCWDYLWSTFPHAVLDASSGSVGLPEGQMGNSEVGHMTIGSGQVILQDPPRINKAISINTLKDNEALLEFIAQLKQTGGACHMMGLVSPGGVHSHMEHMIALAVLMADNNITTYIHAFLDGRDTPPQSAQKFLIDFERRLPETATIATLGGRYFGMDRDKRWDRVQKAYDALMSASGKRFSSAAEAIQEAYTNQIFDEFVEPCVIGDYAGVNARDGLLMANFRADRARQILEALVLPEFSGFERSHHTWAGMLGMVEYAENLSPFVPALFGPETVTGSLGEVVASRGLRQLRIAETEKYAHVTFFFNGGREALFEGEERIMIPSPQVATYDLAPEMSAYPLTERLIEELDQNKFDFVVVNYANPDMVGHTGNIAASIKAVETVDACLKMLSDAVHSKGGALLITADHGNVEEMIDADGVPLTAHTLNLVPFVLVHEDNKGVWLRKTGTLADIAPTVLDLMGLPAPSSMTGQSLVQKHPESRRERVFVRVEN